MERHVIVILLHFVHVGVLCYYVTSSTDIKLLTKEKQNRNELLLPNLLDLCYLKKQYKNH